MRTGVLTWAIGLICATLAVAPAFAQYDDDWRQRDTYDSSQLQPLDRILPEVRRNHPGRFYDAEGPFQGQDGQMHYRLKWMTPEGRVVWFDANARTGRVLGTGGNRHDFEGEGSFDGQGPNDHGPADNQRPDQGRRNHFDEGDYGGAPGDWPGAGPEHGGGNDRGRGDDRGRPWHGGRPHFNFNRDHF